MAAKKKSSPKRKPSFWTLRNIVLIVSITGGTLGGLSAIPQSWVILRWLIPVNGPWVEWHTAEKVNPLDAKLRAGAIATERLNINQLKARLYDLRHNTENKGPALAQSIEDTEIELTAAQKRLDAALAPAKANNAGN